MSKPSSPSQREMLAHFWSLGEEGAADESAANDPLGGYYFRIREADEARWGDLVVEGRRLHVHRTVQGEIQGRWF